MGLTEIYDSAPKARKPYTITKQREKWTEEEHQKFLDALKLYGRGWRQIEEHVGTKTAVQIRSHAQKFFSKVVRGSIGNVEGSVQPIAIPPPRPKKKPKHPYPRKSVDLFNLSILHQSERSPSPSLVHTDKGVKSPTSVLSSHGSDAVGSATSDQNNRSSSMSRTTDLHSIILSPFEKNNGHLLSKSSNEEKSSLPENQFSDCSTMENVLCLKCESGAKNTKHTEEETKLSTSTSFKIFGKIVLLSDLEKGSPSGVEGSKTLQTDQMPVSELSPDQLGTDLCLGGIVSDCHLLACGASINLLEQQKEDSNAVKGNASMLQWSLYQTPCNYIIADNIPSVEQTFLSSCAEGKTKDKEVQKERSCTGSNEGSASGIETLGDTNIEAVNSFSQEPPTKVSVEPCNSRKGFVPYKRCLAERDNVSSMKPNDRERQKIRVC
ncbi:hypothetical protein CsatB_022904 [Cannabis sativa]|uniref:Uncharacterized protein n=2 Tax=Cannabis sativa TaxID=3483 RepID=A0A803QYC0_CANSA